MPRFRFFFLLVLGSGAVLGGVHLLWRGPGNRQATPLLKLVGSETVYPYASAVAETFSREENLRAPVIEAVGTGAGIQLFCRGPGPETPSLLMASRPLTQKDYALCQQNAVPREDIEEIPIGFEGLVFVQSIKAPPLSLTPRALFRALSASEPAPSRFWSDVDSRLPHQPLKILGPSRVSGTYESLVALVLHPFCPLGKELSCLKIRSDGVYMEMGGNQNLLIQKIRQNPSWVGVVSLAFFQKNSHVLRGIPLNGIPPSFENAASRKYPFLRPLFLYMKKNHKGFFPHLGAYVAHFFKKDALGPWGYLRTKGLVPLFSGGKHAS